MYKLKQKCSDFKVDEMPLFDPKELNQDSGGFLYFKLEKENWNTMSAIKEVAKAFGIDSRDINFAGTKDKHAITSQFLSIKSKGRKLKEKLPLNLPDGISTLFVGYKNQQLSLGDLKGNRFGIVVRNLDEYEGLFERKLFVNYFDEQRFSSNNVEVGRAIIKKNFVKAAKLVDDKKAKLQFEFEPNEPLKALTMLPKKLLMLYIHAYQSYLWNETVSRYLRSNFKEKCDIIEYSQGNLVLVLDEILNELMDLNVPLIGALPLDSSVPSEIIEIIETIMDEEEIDRYDFVLRQFPNMSPEGGRRNVVCEIKNLKIGALEADDLNDTKKKQEVSFELGKGSYATMAVKFMFKS